MLVVRQLALPLPPGRGGRRQGAGRKALGPQAGVPHTTRPVLDRRHPSHVTLRARGGLPSFRLPAVFRAVRGAIARTQRERFRICHFSVQSNHLHLIVEAEDHEALSRGMRGLTIRLARAINCALARTGRVWGDRYHRHDLATPSEVRHAVVYVLHNIKKHRPGFRGLDPCSSAWGAARAVVVRARTWLLAVGWRRAGSDSPDGRPERAW